MEPYCKLTFLDFLAFQSPSLTLTSILNPSFYLIVVRKVMGTFILSFLVIY